MVTYGLFPQWNQRQLNFGLYNMQLIETILYLCLNWQAVYTHSSSLIHARAIFHQAKNDLRSNLSLQLYKQFPGGAYAHTLYILDAYACIHDSVPYKIYSAITGFNSSTYLAYLSKTIVM